MVGIRLPKEIYEYAQIVPGRIITAGEFADQIMASHLLNLAVLNVEGAEDGYFGDLDFLKTLSADDMVEWIEFTDGSIEPRKVGRS